MRLAGSDFSFLNEHRTPRMFRKNQKKTEELVASAHALWRLPVYTHSGQEGKQTVSVSWGSPWWIDQLIVEEGWWSIEDDPLCPAHWLRYSRVDSSKRSAGDSPRGLGGRVGWSTVWPASCVARFSPRFPPRGRSTPGFLSALQLAPAMCSLDFGAPFESNRCPLCIGLPNTGYENGNRE